MDNYVAIVFNNVDAATDGLHELWKLDLRGDITVHGAAVLHRDRYGYIQVATKHTDPGLRTAIGIGVGALLGALAGPVGVAAGVAGASTIVAGTAAGIGAATGGVIGLTADAVKSGEHEEAAYESGFVLDRGQSAVIAEISEDWTTPLDTAMKALGGKIYRRPKGAVRKDSIDPGLGTYPDYPYYPYHLYPYDYDPYWAA